MFEDINKQKLFGKTLDELKQIVAALSLPKFTASQIANWLYKKRISSIDQMSNLSKVARTKLSASYTVGVSEAMKVSLSADGTKKYLFKKAENQYIETAMIPETDRKTLCVSSQVGCQMRCSFCMTGKQGLQDNLDTAEILNQLYSIPESQSISNIVFMGMGEPFDNIDIVLKTLEILTSDWGFAMSPRRITVSSIGKIDGLKRFLNESECHLAISLHNPFENERFAAMPIEKTNPIKQVLAEIKAHDFARNRRVSFEYIMFKDYNDNTRHVNELAKILAGIKCRINLIRFHPVAGIKLVGSDEQTIEAFQNKLKAKGIITTLRASRGLDIEAACGLLSTKELLMKNDGNAVES